MITPRELRFNSTKDIKIDSTTPRENILIKNIFNYFWVTASCLNKDLNL